jgi:spermidine/putrescine transport system substrate-binding protein
MRRFGLLLVMLIAVLGVSAVAAQTSVEGIEWACPAEFAGQTLNVYNWSTYVAPDTISNFETLCGVTVNYDVYGSNDELQARLRQGNPGFDIVVPTNDTLASMIAEGLLEPLDHSLIPNMANVSPGLLDTVFDPGNVYSMPYQWGTMGIGYNYTNVGEEVTSWRQFFEYGGTVAWIEDKRAVFAIALKMLSINPNTTDQAEIDVAKAFLIENGSNVISIAPDDGQEQLARGEADMVFEWSGDILQVIAQCAEDPACTSDFRYVIPEEGSIAWIDNMSIPVGALNPGLAHAFIDYILDPKVGADISNFTAFSSPNQAAIDAGLIDEVLLNDPALYPGEVQMENLVFVLTPTGTTEDGQDLMAVTEQLYGDAWDEIKIGIGGS